GGRHELLREGRAVTHTTPAQRTGVEVLCLGGDRREQCRDCEDHEHQAHDNSSTTGPAARVRRRRVRTRRRKAYSSTTGRNSTRRCKSTGFSPRNVINTMIAEKRSV